MADVEFTVHLPAALADKVRERGLEIDMLFAEFVEKQMDHLDNEEEYEDTPDEVILEHLREALTDALAGRDLRPADEVLAELRARRERRENVNEENEG